LIEHGLLSAPVDATNARCAAADTTGGTAIAMMPSMHEIGFIVCLFTGER
jgi:hypothetical protein